MSLTSPEAPLAPIDNQMLLPGSSGIHQVGEGRLQPANSSTPRKPPANNKVTWINPHHLEDHPSNTELFGQQRLLDIEDLVVSLQMGFDLNRPIKVMRRANGAIVMIDGHRRQRTALKLGLKQVPVIYAAFSDEHEERVEMITANLVRNRKYRSVGVGTAVDLIQLLHPREVKRGRPGKENEVQQTRINAEPKRDYYAQLLDISVNKFRMADYVLRNGTKEEKMELDTGPRSTTAIYKAVHARVTGDDLTPTMTPSELVKLAQAAARNTARLMAAAGETVSLRADLIEAEIDSLANQARLEAGDEVPSGTTARAAVHLLSRVIGQVKSMPESPNLRLMARSMREEGE